MENESETTDVTSDYDFDKDADDAEENPPSVSETRITAQANGIEEIPSYDDFIKSAEALYSLTDKPPFAYKKRRDYESYASGLKEVVLRTHDGLHPGFHPSVERPVLTEKSWGVNYGFWVLACGDERYVMKGKGQSYKRCMKIDKVGNLVLENVPFAYGVPDSRSRYGSLVVSESVDDQALDHFMNKSPFQSPATSMPIMTKRRRATQENGQDSSLRKHPRLSIAPYATIEDLVRKDRAYYKRKHWRPPFIYSGSSAAAFTAERVDPDGQPTKQRLKLNSRKWSDHNHYWVTKIDGEEYIVTKNVGSAGEYTLRLWMGHNNHEKSDGSDGRVVGQGVAKPNELGTRAPTPSKNKSVPPSTMPQTALAQEKTANHRADAPYTSTRQRASQKPQDSSTTKSASALGSQDGKHRHTQLSIAKPRRTSSQPASASQIGRNASKDEADHSSLSMECLTTSQNTIIEQTLNSNADMEASLAGLDPPAASEMMQALNESEAEIRRELFLMEKLRTIKEQKRRLSQKANV